MQEVKVFNIEFEHEGRGYKGVVKPLTSNESTPLPEKFEVLLTGDKDPFTIECTNEGWISDDFIVHQRIVDAAGDFIMRYYQ